MRRLTLDDCEHLVAAKAGPYEVDRVLEGGEDTVGVNGVLLEVVSQLRDALAVNKGLLNPGTTELAGTVVFHPSEPVFRAPVAPEKQALRCARTGCKGEVVGGRCLACDQYLAVEPVWPRVTG